MTLEKTNLDADEAREMLADILDSLEATAQWCAKNAAEALGNLQDEWQHTCAVAEAADSEPFRQQCHKLLEDCAIVSFRLTTSCRLC